MNNPLDALRHHVTGAIERGEAEVITEMKASTKTIKLTIEETCTYNIDVEIPLDADADEWVAENAEAFWVEQDMNNHFTSCDERTIWFEELP